MQLFTSALAFGTPPIGFFICMSIYSAQQDENKQKKRILHEKTGAAFRQLRL